MSTWYISPAGNDTTGTGTSLLPWATISKAHTSAASGDTIICKASATAYTWANQTFTKSLTIRGESVPVYNGLTKAWTGAIFDAGNSSVLWGAASDLTVVMSLSRLIFRNGFGGLSYDQGPFSFHTFTFERNVMYDIQWQSLISCSLIAFATNRTIIIRNSLFYGQKTGSAATAALIACWNTGGAGSVTIQNCGLYGDTIGLISANKSIPLTVKNNIFVNTGSSVGLVIQSGSTVYENNIAYGAWTYVPSGSNNLTSNPLLVDPVNGDFRLRPGSPAINVGVAI